MKIDKKKLIELLVTKTGMDTTEVEDQLEQLIRRIIDAAERGKALEIKEFGLFYFDEGGELKFDPSKELSTEINFKYAGMEPVELKPPRDITDKKTAESAQDKPESDSADVPSPQEESEESEEDLSSIFGFDESAAKSDEDVDEDENEDEIELPWSDITDQEESTEPKGAAEDEDEDEYDDEIPERDEDPFAGLLGDASSKLSAAERGIFGDEEKPSHPLIPTGDEDVTETPEPEKREEIEETLPAPEPDPKPEKAKPKPKPVPKSVPAPSLRAETEKSEAKDEPEKSSDKPQPAKPAVAAGKKKASAPASRKVTPGYSGSQKRKDPIMIVMGIVLVFIIVAATLLLIPGVFSDPEPETQSQPQTQPEATTEVINPSSPDMTEQIPAEGTESENETVPETELQEQLPPPEPEPEDAVTDNVTADPEAEAAASNNGYGLRGNLNEEANDGFSIVLHSLSQEANARSIAAELMADNYRVLVSGRTVNGQSVWRVSVGQFETIANAQEAALTLPSPYNTNNFIQRIQTN